MQISSGGEATVLPGQTSAGIDVLSGGQFFVDVSGTAEGTTIERGGVVQVLGGLTVDDTIFGGEEQVYFGTAHVSSGGTTVVISGAGTAIGLTITQRGVAKINSGAVAQNATIVSSGALDVNVGASAIGTIVGRGAVDTVTGTITAGGVSGGTGGTLDKVGSGTLTLDGAVSGVNLVAGGGDLIVSGTLDSASTLTINGGTLELPGATSANVRFADPGTLLLDAASAFSGVIGGFGVGDVLDLASLQFQSAISAVFSGSTLVISAGGSSLDLNFDPAQLLLGPAFSAIADSGGDTEFTMALSALSSAALNVMSGQYSTDINVVSGGTLGVQSGGTSVDTNVGSSGLLIISSGGSADPTVISAGGTEIIGAHGSDNGAQISGGTQLVFGTATSTTIFGGTQVVESGGTAVDTTVSGGVLVVQSGATLRVDTGFSNTTISSGGALTVLSGGLADPTKIVSGGIEIVSAGGSDQGAQISGGGTQINFGFGGSASVFTRGVQVVGSGGRPLPICGRSAWMRGPSPRMTREECLNLRAVRSRANPQGFCCRPGANGH